MKATNELLYELGIHPDVADQIQWLLDEKSESDQRLFHMLVEKRSMEDIARELEVSRQTLWRYKKEHFDDVKTALREGHYRNNSRGAAYCGGEYVKQIKFRANESYKIGLSRLAMLDGSTVQDEIIEMTILNVKERADMYTGMAETAMDSLRTLGKLAKLESWDETAKRFDLDADPVAEIEKQETKISGYIAKAKMYRDIENQMSTTLRWKQSA